ncbi:mitochondrial nucleoid-associated protein 1 [Chaetodon trifascialis]|uniref:mitochondrial nucleoid-associated protein 1 n=1 Tax=Chaetodon trifascialis TaxID=109706 RepID=UPI0039920E80
MNSEVCPFCGKTYKRLKSHLPHCKAAVSSETPPSKHDVKVNQTAASSRLTTASIEPTAKGEKSPQLLSMMASPQLKKSKKVSVVSSAPLRPSAAAKPLPSANTSTSSESLSLSSASPPPATKKKKQKLSEQIKAATMASSTTTSPISTQSQPQSLSNAISKAKKKSLRDLIEAAKSNQVSKGLMEGTRSSSEDLPSASTPFVVDPLSSRTTVQTETKTNPDKDLVKDNSHPTSLSTETKPKSASKTKVSKTKSLSTTKDISSSPDSTVNTSGARSHVRDLDNEGEIEDLFVDKIFLRSGSGHQARITLQDVRATLGRANTTRQSSRPSILNQIGTTDDLSSKIRPGTGLRPTKTLSDQLPSKSSQRTELQSVKRKSSKSKPTALIPLRHDGSPQPELVSPTTPLLPGHLLSQVSQAKSHPHTVSMNEGLKVGHHMTGLPTISPSLNQFSSPHLFLLAPQALPARVETLRADDGLMMATSQREVRRESTADNGFKGALTQRSLGQVRLRELPEWLAYKTPRRPREVVEMVQRGWQWYYKRYIDVKKGGVGGLGMLLAGYCVLSYIWSYPHIKRDRWRKYH